MDGSSGLYYHHCRPHLSLDRNSPTLRVNCQDEKRRMEFLGRTNYCDFHVHKHVNHRIGIRSFPADASSRPSGLNTTRRTACGDGSACDRTASGSMWRRTARMRWPSSTLRRARLYKRSRYPTSPLAFASVRTASRPPGCCTVISPIVPCWNELCNNLDNCRNPPIPLPAIKG